MSRLRHAHSIPPLIVLFVALTVAVFAVVKFWTVTSETCPINQVNGLLPTGSFIAIIGAFFLGGAMGGLQRKHRDATSERPTAEQHEVPGLWAHLGLTIFAALVTFAWWYETKAVADPSFHPITYFIMCIRTATQDTDDWAVVVFMLAALIAGRWLWHREGSYW